MATLSYRRNIPLFIAFRVLFTARWYYPGMTVLFLDLGLSLEQFALLNVAWAATVVGLEVPFGAIADRFGRKRMVVLAAVLMVAEMAIFIFAPRGNPSLLFAFFLANRVLSGIAEACASGVDEALAYDSLVIDGQADRWPRVLELLMRWQSVGFFVTMILGAAVYDPALLQNALHTLGLPGKVTPEMAINFPFYLTLGNALMLMPVALSFREPQLSAIESSSPKTTTPSNAWRAVLQAGRWIVATPLVLAVILTGLCFDSIIRLYLNFGSNYYRLITIPIAAFGLVSSGFALLGFVVPTLARRMLPRWSMWTNFSIVGALLFLGLFGISQVWPIYGLLWLIPIGMAMSFLQFFVSHYLNTLITDSTLRATVLSFRGLAYNLAYGAVGLLFAGLIHSLKVHALPGGNDDSVFIAALAWLPWYFLATVFLLVIVVRRKLRPAA